jgi:CheY-like chemotaxis protein
LKKHIGTHDNLQEYVENILITGRRAATLTSQLLAFSRFEKPRLSEIDLNFLISEVINLLKHTIDPKIRMHKELRSPFSIIEGDESQLHNAILNLAVNARDAMPAGGDMTFATDFQEFTTESCIGEFVSLKPGRHIILSIKDSGSGIPTELISHIFEPFFTTKEKGKGTGLGLAAVYGTVLAHNGVITVQSQVNTYTVFKLYLPLLINISLTTSSTENNDLSSISNKKRILVVDDEALLCTLACELLSDAGFLTLAANNGVEALNIYKKDFQNIDLVIVDMLMPNMNGTELLVKMLAINPMLKAIVVSGFTGNLDLNEILKNKKFPYLQKPYEERNLLKLIEQTISK